MKPVKRTLTFLLAVMVTLLFAGCTDKTPEMITDATYCSAPGRYGDIDVFCVTLHADGSFTYSASPLSSYIGIGTWTREGNVITLRDTEPYPAFAEDGAVSDYYFVNRFRVERGALVFIEDGSTNFLYRKLTDGERLTAAD